MTDISEIKSIIRNADPKIKGYIAELKKQIQTLLLEQGKQEARHYVGIEKLKVEHDKEMQELREELGFPLSPEEVYKKIIKRESSSK